MKILIDENIIYAREAFELIGDVKLKPGWEINNSDLIDCDILIVRSVTTVNKKLLNGTKVKFVGSATIGDDHIDKEYLHENNIGFSTAKGCNAQAVAEYVFNVISKLAIEQNFELKNKSIGIVGVGNIGHKIHVMAEALEMKPILNDPPLQRENPDLKYSSLPEALNADIVTFHVPLNKGGLDNTVHLLNNSNISLIRSKSILINASRGPVISGDALLSRLSTNNDLTVVLDVWENEPYINSELLKLIKYGTPHIAGYSYRGKVNGTQMIFDAVVNYFALNVNWLPPADNKLDLKIDCSGLSTREEVLYRIFNDIYQIENDDSNLREIFALDNNSAGQYFNSLRKNYDLRKEVSEYKIVGSKFKFEF